MQKKKIKRLLPIPFLKFYFFCLLSILVPFISYGMHSDVDEIELESYSSYPRQSLLINTSETSESPSSSLKLLIKKPSPDQLAEETSSNEPNIISWAYIQAFQDDVNEESNKSLILKCIASMGGFGAGIPGIAAALDAGKYFGSSNLGYIFATSTILYTGGVAGWAIWELIERSQSSPIHSKLDSEKQCKGRAGKVVGSLILGVFSSAPQVYVAYKYNTIKGITALSFLYEWMFRSLGFFEFISSIKFNKKPHICEIEMNKNRALECVDMSKIHFLRLHQGSNGQELSLILKSLTQPKEIYSYLKSTISPRSSNLRTHDVLPYYYAKGIPRKLTQYSSLIFPFAGAFVNGVLSYKGFSIITDNTPALIILTGISVLPTLVLDSFATKEVAGGVFDAIYSYKSRVLPSEYFDFFHPKLKRAIIGGALVVSIAATGVGVYVILDNLEGTFLSPAKYAFTALAGISAVEFGAYAMVNTLINIGTVAIKQFKKTSAYTFNCLKKLNNLRISIWESSTSIVTEFLDEIEIDSPEY